MKSVDALVLKILKWHSWIQILIILGFGSTLEILYLIHQFQFYQLAMQFSIVVIKVKYKHCDGNNFIVALTFRCMTH